MFRAPDVSTAIDVYLSLLGMNGPGVPLLFSDIWGVEATVSGLTGLEIFPAIVLLWWVWTKPNVHEIVPGDSRWTLPTMSAAWVAILMSITAPSAFLYFQF